jgi:tagaturonate reductase
LKSRVLPLLLNHYKQGAEVPDATALGFAAFIRFMKITRTEDGKFMGNVNGEDYVVTDANAERFYKAWLKTDVKTVIETILKDNHLWDTDLTLLPGFKAAVIKNVEAIMDSGTLPLLENFEIKALIK